MLGLQRKEQILCRIRHIVSLVFNYIAQNKSKIFTEYLSYLFRKFSCFWGAQQELEVFPESSGSLWRVVRNQRAPTVISVR